MATEPKKPAAGRAAGKSSKAPAARASAKATEPKASQASPGAAKAPDPKAPDLKAVEGRISALEAGLQAAETRMTQRTATLESRLVAVESREAPAAQRVNLPEGVPESVRQGINRAVDLVRHNPITALILIVAFLLVAIFS